MRYLIISIVFILTVVGVHRLIVSNSTDVSREAGLRRTPVENVRQSQEEKTSFDIQRNNRNEVPRHE